MSDALSRIQCSQLVGRPDAGGWWLWYEGVELSSDIEGIQPQRILVSSCGKEVVTDDEFRKITGYDPDHDGMFHENYWEMTRTNQKEMPGIWRKESVSDE